MGATIGVLAPVGVPGTAGSDRRMLALLVSLRERSGLNWRVTDSLGFLVPCTYKFTANDSRFEMHCAPASVATCDHMKQPTGAFCVGCFMWRTMWRLVALCFASRPIESRYIWGSVTRSATENGPECATLHGLSLHVSSRRGGEVVGRDPLHTRKGISMVGWSASDRRRVSRGARGAHKAPNKPVAKSLSTPAPKNNESDGGRHKL